MKNNYPKLPNKHWRYVVGGVVQENDMLWTPEDENWGTADDHEIGTPVTCWKCVIRQENKKD